MAVLRRNRVHVALPKRPMIQFRAVQQSRQHPLRAVCPNIHNTYLLINSNVMGFIVNYSSQPSHGRLEKGKLSKKKKKMHLKSFF